MDSLIESVRQITREWKSIDGIIIRLERLLNLISSLDESYSSLVNFEEITDNVCALLAKLTKIQD